MNKQAVDLQPYSNVSPKIPFKSTTSKFMRPIKWAVKICIILYSWKTILITLFVKTQPANLHFKNTEGKNIYSYTEVTQPVSKNKI